MKRKTNFNRQWQLADPDELIDCPFQPGNLKISKKACLKRRKASREERLFQTMKNEFFSFTIKQGLLICKNCPG